MLIVDVVVVIVDLEEDEVELVVVGASEDEVLVEKESVEDELVKKNLEEMEVLVAIDDVEEEEVEEFADVVVVEVLLVVVVVVAAHLSTAVKVAFDEIDTFLKLDVFPLSFQRSNAHESLPSTWTV